MRQTEDHVIGEFTYKITQLGAKEGRLVLARIFRAVGGAVSADSVEDAISKFSASLADADIEFLCDKFAAATMFAEGDRAWRLSDKFDEHFAGRYDAMLKWLWACVQTNYSSFLGGLNLNPGQLQAALSAKTSTSTAPTTPSGASSSPTSGG